MKIRHIVSFAAFGLIVVCAVSYIASLGIRIRPPSDRVNVSMQVADTNGLVADSNVLLRGVPVGKITKIRASADSATIDFYIDKRFPIPVDSEVRLENLSALGESYIGLMPRSTSGPMLRDGQRVATADIKAPASISELSTSIVRALKQMDPGELKRLVDEVDRALPNGDAVLPNLNRASTLLRNTSKTMNGQGSEMLANFQTLLQNAGWVGPALAKIGPPLLQTGYDAGKTFAQGVLVFGATGPPYALNYLSDIMNVLQHFLDTRAPDLKVIAQALTPNVQGMAAALMNVDTGRILSNILTSFPEDGTVTLHLTVPNR